MKEKQELLQPEFEQELQKTQEAQDQSLRRIFDEYYETLKETNGSAIVFWKENEEWKGLFLKSPDTQILYQEKKNNLEKLKKIKEIDMKSIVEKEFEFKLIYHDEYEDIDRAIERVLCNYGSRNSNISHLIYEYECCLDREALPEKYSLLEHSNFGKNLIHFAEKYSLALKIHDPKIIAYYTDLWNIYKEGLEYIYKKEFEFVYKSCLYYGIRPTGSLYENIWLLKVEEYFDIEKETLELERKTVYNFADAEKKAQKLYDFLKEMNI